MSRTDLMNLERVPRILLLALVVVLSLLTNALATIINVPAEQTTIQAGIDLANNGDTVLVATGYYRENISFRGKEIVVSSHFLLDSDPAYIFSTIIDGSNSSNPDTASTVRIFCGSTEAPVFQGFTVTGGEGTIMRGPNEGLYNRFGAGIATRLGAPVIRFNYIHHNQPSPALACAGGGIYLQLGDPTIEKNIIAQNTGRSGCGITIHSADVTARNNVIAFNSGGEAFGGGGIYIYVGQIDGYNNTIAFNHSIRPGGGVRVAAASIYLCNSIVWGNSSSSGSSPQTYIAPGYGGTIALEYSDIEGGYAGTGNIDSDPMLNGDLVYLFTGSPCIDAGHPGPGYLDREAPWATGIARWPSKGGLRNDMGAYGGQGMFAFEWFHIAAYPGIGMLPLDVSFEAESSFELESCEWDFGDGATADGLTTSHLYETLGAHDVTMTVEYDGDQQEARKGDSVVIVLADSLVGDQIETHHASCEFAVRIVNTVPLTRLVVPIEWTSTDLQLSLSATSSSGCRTEAFGSLTYRHYDPQFGKRFTVEFPIDESNPLPPGAGPILKLLFAFDNPDTLGQAATVSLSGYDSWTPEIKSSEIAIYFPFIKDGSIVYTSCCTGLTGNVDNDPGEVVDLGDLTKLIDYLFISFIPPFCLKEANLDGDPEGQVDLSDLTTLIDYLFISFTPPAECL